MKIWTVLVVLFVSSLLLGACLRWVKSPPSRYVYAFRGPVDVRRVSADEAQEVCQFRTAIPGREGAGCSWIDGEGRCKIIISVRAPDFDETVRHEVAHCNGWPADHPD